MTPQERKTAFLAEYTALVKKYGLDFQAVLEPNMIGTYQNGVKPNIRIMEFASPLPAVTPENTVTPQHET